LLPKSARFSILKIWQTEVIRVVNKIKGMAAKLPELNYSVERRAIWPCSKRAVTARKLDRMHSGRIARLAPAQIKHRRANARAISETGKNLSPSQE
jgi:hypothetical protein